MLLSLPPPPCPLQRSQLSPLTSPSPLSSPLSPLFPSSPSLSLALSSTPTAPPPKASLTPAQVYSTVLSVVVNLFPLWTILSTALALKSPSSFAWFTTEYFTAALAALMLSMGITLKPSDFVKVGERPNAIFVQFALCYMMMPTLAVVMGKFFKMEPGLLAGMVRERGGEREGERERERGGGGELEGAFLAFF